ncbi:polyphosphate--glucose phosphotransferase [Brachybacterium timonense]|uniref:polyphosphate--glucose phosphotransferase n=1 Tax=Brachybacterium timonense TaxID=2050896 RepID=UPI000D0AD534|nr:ROK family protein [Brachybacterium timonense]
MTRIGFGIDIGGSGIKGATVDLKKGSLAADRVRIPTPQPSLPEAVADTVAEVLSAFDLEPGVPVGVTFPGIIQHGVVLTAANMDPSWVNVDVQELFTKRTGHDVFAVNDGDAAGVAEMAFGAGKKTRGTVMLTTLGTGVGTALFVDGHLVPNTELGHIPLVGHDDAEKWMAESIRDRESLTWEEWAERLQVYYSTLEFLFSPDLFIVGGGVSKKHENFLPLLDLRTPIVPARTRNEAGIIGAAVLANEARAGQEGKKKQKGTAKTGKKKSKDGTKGGSKAATAKPQKSSKG